MIFSNPNFKSYVKACQAKGKFPRALLLTGPDGCGKEAALAWYAHKRGLEYEELGHDTIKQEPKLLETASLEPILFVVKDLHLLRSKIPLLFTKHIDSNTRREFVFTSGSKEVLDGSFHNKCIHFNFFFSSLEVVSEYLNKYYPDLSEEDVLHYAKKIYYDPRCFEDLTFLEGVTDRSAMKTFIKDAFSKSLEELCKAHSSVFDVNTTKRLEQTVELVLEIIKKKQLMETRYKDAILFLRSALKASQRNTRIGSSYLVYLIFSILREDHLFYRPIVKGAISEWDSL